MRRASVLGCGKPYLRRGGGRCQGAVFCACHDACSIRSPRSGRYPASPLGDPGLFPESPRATREAYRAGRRAVAAGCSRRRGGRRGPRSSEATSEWRAARPRDDPVRDRVEHAEEERPEDAAVVGVLEGERDGRSGSWPPARSRRPTRARTRTRLRPGRAGCRARRSRAPARGRDPDQRRECFEGEQPHAPVAPAAHLAKWTCRTSPWPRAQRLRCAHSARSVEGTCMPTSARGS